MILLMGEHSDEQVLSVAAQLDAMQQEYAVLDGAQFPVRDSISYFPEQDDLSLCIDGRVIALSDVKAMYWRNYRQPANPSANPIAAKDATSLLMTTLNQLGEKSKNSASAVRYHQEKPRQLAAVAQLGVRIPATYVGNHLAEVRAFCQQHQKAIFKPVTGGDYAQVITAEHLDDEHLTSSLRLAPITLQAFIAGTNIRSYVIGDRVFSAEINSEHDDFRTDRNVNIQPIQLPEAVRLQALAIIKELGLAWSGIDWRRDQDGNYFFLEANPSPMFVNFERFTGLPIAKHLAQLLVA